MDPTGVEEAAARYMLDAINEDTRANIEEFGAEDSQTNDSFLNMSGDGSEEDDDFAPTPV